MTDVTAGTTSDDDVALNVVYKASIDLVRARAAFDDPTWLGQISGDPPTDGWRRVEADLELPVLDGSGPFGSQGRDRRHRGDRQKPMAA